MGRRRKKPIYVIADWTIGCIGEDRILDLESDPDEPLCDELQCPVADEVLVALRQSFTLSYPRNPLMNGLTESLAEIRRVCIEALIEMPEVLSELKLSPIPPVFNDDRVGRTKAFQFFLARVSDLRIKVKHEAKSRSLFTLLETMPADVLVATAREIVSLTFSEIHDEEQHAAILEEIRQRIWTVLPAYNEYLKAIEVEPVAPLPCKQVRDEEPSPESQ